MVPFSKLFLPHWWTALEDNSHGRIQSIRNCNWCNNRLPSLGLGQRPQHIHFHMIIYEDASIFLKID